MIYFPPMATLKQKALAKAIVENAEREKPLNKKELVVSSGYSVISAESSAHLLMEQAGVKAELAVLGFDVATAKSVVGEILTDERKMPKDRLKAADMVFKVHGAYVPELPPSQSNTYNIFFNPEIQKATLAYEESLKALLEVNEDPHDS